MRAPWFWFLLSSLFFYDPWPGRSGPLPGSLAAVLGGQCNSSQLVLGEPAEEDLPPVLDSAPDFGCDTPNIDAATTTADKRTFFFKGDYYWRILSNGSVASGYPRWISQDWEGLPGHLDAALTWRDGRIFFFKGTQYWSFHGRSLDAGYPRNISEGFCGIPDSLDAAFLWKDNMKAFFFKGERYWRFDGGESSPVVQSSKAVSEWTGAPDRVDAAFQSEHGRTHFLRKKRVFKYDDLGIEDEEEEAFNRKWGLDCFDLLELHRDMLKRQVENPWPSWLTYLVVAVGLVAFSLAACLGCLAVFIVRRKAAVSQEQTRKALERVEKMSASGKETNIPFDLRWEFPKQRLLLGKKIGQGAFGRVVKAQAAGIKDSEETTTVAVKMLKVRAELIHKRALLDELKVLILLGHHLNVVNLLGAVTKYMNNGELLLIVEYCGHGSLREYLVKHKQKFVNQLDPGTGRVDTSITACPATGNSQSLDPGDLELSQQSRLNDSGVFSSVDSGRLLVTGHLTSSGKSMTTTGSVVSNLSYEEEELSELSTSDLLSFAFQCARGMEYISSRKLVHRDLAARNILLTSENVIKICDFGLTKDLNYLYQGKAQKKNTPLPVRWMAPEAIGQNTFSSKSDVWSFGILLWETFTLGDVPYPGMTIDEAFYDKILRGYRLDRPEFAPTSLYSTMLSCWEKEPEARPSFDVLEKALGSEIEESVKEHYLELNVPFVELNAQNPNYSCLGRILENLDQNDELGEISGLPVLESIPEAEVTSKGAGEGAAGLFGHCNVLVETSDSEAGHSLEERHAQVEEVASEQAGSTGLLSQFEVAL